MRDVQSISNREPQATPGLTSSMTVEPPGGAFGWFMVFGPGAIVASLTIGTGELIFSSRGGALFGYRILSLFIVITLLKWGLVVASARHMVLTGVHPYRRLMELPGPRGWFPILLFLIAMVCLPIWISFHAGVIGNLMSWITGTRGMFGGGIDYAWGAIILSVVLVLSAGGGYSALERVQLAIVTALIACASISLVLYKPDWLGLVAGAIVPQRYEYPDWLSEDYPAIAATPVWVETTRYVGVIGGASFDYMTYVSFLREKRWGHSSAEVTMEQLERIADDPSHVVRRWIRAPLVDCSVSAALIVIFSTVFVACGTIVLGPHHTIPDENNFLNLQSRLVTDLHPWLLPLYVAGAFLAMVGTLYGTIEVACYIFSEIVRSTAREFTITRANRVRRASMLWCGAGAFAILAWLFTDKFTGGHDKPRMLLAILTPANLFTGVLGCGLFCLVNIWMDRRFLPAKLRMPAILFVLNLVAGVVFLLLGIKGYWDHDGRWHALISLCVLLMLAYIGASVRQRRL